MSGEAENQTEEWLKKRREKRNTVGEEGCAEPGRKNRTEVGTERKLYNV